MAFIDETGAAPQIARRSGRARRAQRLKIERVSRLLRDAIGQIIQIYSSAECANDFAAAGHDAG